MEFDQKAHSGKNVEINPDNFVFLSRERTNEEYEFSSGRLCGDLGYFLRVPVFGRPPHGEPARRYTPFERGREVANPSCGLRE